MTLKSQLFRGDPLLEAAAVSDPAHITPGSRGEHVRKIQLALIQLDGAAIIADESYGPATAAAVLAYKRKRNIINRSYQTAADNIVGKMTIAALDREMMGEAEPVVVIGRPGVRPILAFAIDPSQLAQIGVPQVSPISASVAAVIRGNPHVRANAVDIGLPASVPPGQSYLVDKTVTPALTGSDVIDLEIINTGQSNGSAAINPKQIKATTRVTVLGGTQTDPGHAGKLQIQASMNGKVLATSSGFSVCAHPTSITAHSPAAIDVDDLSGVGMMIRETLESDSGAVSHLDQVEWSELVDPIVRDEPPFGGGSGFINNSGFKPAIPPQGLSIVDRHVEPRPSAGPKGQVVKVQVHMFNCKRCGASEIPIPSSGFEITHDVFKQGAEFKHKVTKKPLDTGVRIPGSKKIIKAKGGIGTVTSALHKPGPK